MKKHQKIIIYPLSIFTMLILLSFAPANAHFSTEGKIIDIINTDNGFEIILSCSNYCNVNSKKATVFVPLNSEIYLNNKKTTFSELTVGKTIEIMSESNLSTVNSLSLYADKINILY